MFGRKSYLTLAALAAAGATPATAQLAQPDDLVTELPNADTDADDGLSASDPAASRFSLSVGAAAWHGDFGAPTDTDIFSVLFGARYQIGDLRLQASLPYMRIDSRGTFFSGIGGTPLFAGPNIQPADRKRDGIGDATLGASYLLGGAREGGVDVEFNGRMKLPIASDASGLSTGEFDYSLGAEVSRPFGRLTPSVSATYRFFGDTPDLRFADGIYATAGATYALTDRAALLVSYEFSEAASRFITDSHELIIGLSTPVASDRFRIAGYASTGLSRGAADVSGGASLSLAF